jgi:GAF domain-containing protein
VIFTLSGSHGYHGQSIIYGFRREFNQLGAIMSSHVSTAGVERDLSRKVRELEIELTEARRQQAATADVLKVISRSKFDLGPVLETLVENATRLAAADAGLLARADGDVFRIVAGYGASPDVHEYWRRNVIRPGRGAPIGRAALERRTVHIVDLLADREYDLQEAQRIHGGRSVLAVPMSRQEKIIGVFFIYRTIVLAFTEKQIELVTTFAEQAVIAIENTRLFEAEQARTKELVERTHELTESLEYQTATSDILAVISRSPNELQPVLNTIVATAARICKAQLADIAIVEGENIRIRASFGGLGRPAGQIVPLERSTVMGRSVLDRVPVHVADLQCASDDFRIGRELARKYGHRTIAGVPLIRGEGAVGSLLLRRSEVAPFSDKQIALLQTFADQAVIAIENTRLFEAEQVSKRELQQSLEYQTAISEVLGVISRSPTDVQPVFDTIARSALQLCAGTFSSVLRFDGRLIHFVAAHGMTPEGFEALRSTYPLRPGRAGATTRAIETGAVAEIPDVNADPDFEHHHVAGPQNFKSLASVPMLKDGRPIGTITVGQSKTGHFPRRQIQLLRTFADQAVIAIENTRLFEAEQASKRELQESLEYQTATSEVLSVISRSPNDLQPVLDTISATAGKLCEADDAHVLMLREGKFHLIAHNQSDPKVVAWFRANPFGIEDPGSVSARAARQGHPVHVHDVRADPDFGVGGPITFSNGRSVLSVPLLRDGAVLGVVTVSRRAVRPFTDRQIALVQTFADQAVIAISNVGLFEEVQARNTELRVALEQQTATSELLKVIGRSTFDIQPVFETLAENAVRLCEAERSFIFRFDGQLLRVVATHNASEEVRRFVEQNPITPGTSGAAARAALYRRTVHIHDAQTDADYTYGSRRVDPFRTIVTVPILRADELLGVILIYRHEVRPFTPGQIALLETFADQAGIAIENTRLVQEVQARNRDLTALGEVGRAVGSTLDLKLVLKTIVDRAVELSGTDGGSIFYCRNDIGRFELGETTGLDEDVVARFRNLDITTGQTGLGEAIVSRKPVQVADVTNRPSNPLRDAAIEAGLRAALIVPLLSAEAPLGALVLQRRRPGEFSRAVVSLMQNFADQSAIALENARLFDEIAQKSRELEIASQHKSQFVANMSHELRTPLAAILGYAELIQEGFYEPQGPKSLDALTRIRSNGKHLLGLINTVLDIAKIESGQFTLNITEYAIESVVDTVRSATESLAQNKKLVLKTEVAKFLPAGLGDEQRLTQVLLNLVGNAIKFTDAGEVRVTAKAVNGHFNVSVTDTGPGIPEEHQTRIFEQFHQVDSSNTKAKGGTGLGLAIAKKIVEMHGGRIWVESTVGKGSTFQMEIPARAQVARSA